MDIHTLKINIDIMKNIGLFLNEFSEKGPPRNFHSSCPNILICPKEKIMAC